MKQRFYEEDISDLGEERLGRIASILVLSPNGWYEYIDNLEMVVIDGRIFVRGWATPYRWNKFTQRVLIEGSNDRLENPNYEAYLKKKKYMVIGK